MSFDQSVTVRIGNSFWLNWLAVKAVARRFAPHVVVVVSVWIAFGVWLHQAILHAALAMLVIAVGVVCNVLGIDPGQLLVRGSITFSSDHVEHTNLLGHTKRRTWDWISGGEERAGNLHIVFGRHRSRAVAFGRLMSQSNYQFLRALLAAHGKLG